MERADFTNWKTRDVVRLISLVEGERRYYHELLNLLPVPLAVTTHTGDLISTNRNFRERFNFHNDAPQSNILQLLPSAELLNHIASTPVHGMANRAVLEIRGRYFRITAVAVRNWNDESGFETLLMVEDAAPSAPILLPPPLPNSAIDRFPAVVWQADAERLTFRSVTGDVEGLLGYPSAHWLDTKDFFSERIHPDDRSSTLDFFQDAIAQNIEATAEYRAVAASGDPVWCRETVQPLSPGVVTGVITDISIRKRLNAQVVVAERASAVREMAARVARDLNHPAMIATGYAEELLHTMAPGDPLRGEVEQILSATRRISAVAGQYAGIARMQANPASAVDLTNLVMGLRERILDAAGPFADVEFADLGEVVWAGADPVQLQEVILALVSAGRADANIRSRIVIACGVESIRERAVPATLKPGLHASVTIQTDIGIDPSGQEYGAGKLARAYSIVRQWGGDIAFLHDTDVGSTLILYLPYREAGSAVPEPAAVQESAIGTVLVAGVDTGIRELIRKILEREGYQVLVSDDPRDPTGPDLLVTNLTQRALIPRSRQTLYLAGFSADEAERAAALESGGKLLDIPFTLSGLVQAVQEAMDAR